MHLQVILPIGYGTLEMGEYQSVLMLWAVEDFSYKEIADALDIPIGTVMSRLHRVRQKLSEELQEYAIEARIVPVKRE